MVNIEMLKQKITDSGMTTTAVCEKSGITRQTLYNRYKYSDFTLAEVDALKSTLRLTASDVRKIFFANKVE